MLTAYNYRVRQGKANRLHYVACTTAHSFGKKREREKRHIAANPQRRRLRATRPCNSSTMPSRRTSFSSSSSSSPPLPPSSSSGLTESEWLELPPFWDPETVPAGDSEEFLSLVSYEARGDSPFTPNEKFRTRWRDPANPRTSASFGNNGVTASVNPAGELIQLSAYLGLGTSGMFAANRSDFSEPYWVQDRAHELLQLGREYVRIGFGLERPRRWNRAVFEGYHCDRWPVYTSSSEGLAVSTTWMVHDGVILQRTHLDNLKDEPQVVPLSVLVDVHIFALDHVKSAHEFNEKGIFGHLKQPNDCGWIAINRMANQDTTDDIAVLMSVFVDGRPYMLDERHRDEDSFRIDIPILPNSRGPQVVVAYKMATIPQRADAALLNWEDFVIPGEAANFDKHLEETEGLYVGITASELVRKREHSAEAAGATRSAIEFMGLPDDGKSQVQHIDYSVRRNLEHILSVCSVPIESSSGGELIALTCGDLSGHRITSSASL